MGAPQLAQTSRSYAPGSRHRFLISFGLCLAFGSWCATQFTAYQLGFHPALGAPAFTLPLELHGHARFVLSVCLGTAAILLFLPERRRFSPSLLLLAGIVAVVDRWPVYGPIRFFLWSYEFRQSTDLVDIFSDARLVLAAGTFVALVATSPLTRHGRSRRASPGVSIRHAPRAAPRSSRASAAHSDSRNRG